MHDPITIDFETKAIEGNPLVTPPQPVGVAVWVPGREPVYLAWGHPEENNCSWADAHDYLCRIRDAGRPLLFHNAGFDISVWETYFCNARLHWHKNDFWKLIHDTMYLLFLDNPYSANLGLKPNANLYLGMEASEQDDLKRWILRNVAGATNTTFGAYISRAPGDVVEPYAIGDVVRTRGLYDKLFPKIVENGMEPAYDRERRLFPTTFWGTRNGIRLDRHTLEHHERVYSRCLEIVTHRLADRLGISDTSVDVDDRLADALEASGAVSEWVLTKTGKRSMAKGNLKIADPGIKILVEYKGALESCLQNFMRPWLEFSAADGRVHPNWNQVRQPKDERNSKGTRTGRLSSDSPNFQNPPTEYTDLLGNELIVPDGLHPVPYMRRYCLPEEGHVWIKRDFSSQEIRILAHFEDGSLQEAYRANPDLDPHQMAIELINGLIGVLYARKEVKITGFSIIYGSGAQGLARQLGQDAQSAYRIKASYLAAFPSVRELMDDIQRRGRSDQSIRTWGGRIYYREPSREINGRMMDFAYKLLNYLIQGSAADHTKEAVCDWASLRRWFEIFLATVHDEINISAPKEEAPEAMRTLKKAMDADRFDVPIRSEGFIGPNWHDLEEYSDE
jgi:DNA polymerase-1